MCGKISLSSKYGKLGGNMLSLSELNLIQQILKQGFIYSKYIGIEHEWEDKFPLECIVIHSGYVMVHTKYEDFPLGDYKNTWGLKKGEYKYNA